MTFFGCGGQDAKSPNHIQASIAGYSASFAIVEDNEI